MWQFKIFVNPLFVKHNYRLLLAKSCRKLFIVQPISLIINFTLNELPTRESMP